MDEHNNNTANQELPEGYQPGSDADIHISSIVFVGVIGTVLILVIVLLLKALYYQTLETERQRKLGQGINVALSDLNGKQLEQLGQYRWVNAQQAKVGIPIQDAMQLVWQEQSAATSSTFEITDWDHSPSDQHAVPGDLVMSRTRGGGSAPGASMVEVINLLPNDDPPAENTRAEDDISGNEGIDPYVVVETPAEEHQAGDGDAAGGHQ